MNKILIAIIALLLVVLVAQFVFLGDNPDAFAEEGQETAMTIPIEAIFTVAETQNDAVRKLWTAEIVGKGKEVGLSFHEDWRKTELEAGPLPALFLRETGAILQQSPVPLGLFLGSDFPINDANKFTGTQVEKFALIKESGEPQFFFEEDTVLYTAMYSDIAVAKPCVSCHNTHEQTPKDDWALGDAMGATTWSYPKKEVTLDEALAILAALESSFRTAYDGYSAKAETFENPPKVGQQWPAEGYFIPTTDAFMTEAKSHYASETLDVLFAHMKKRL
ncbi:DUF3365 domain-containing protein [Chloroflexi bacterium TSY]|nr:DUF3365 domain-containing protein [Chloroflexi bacterium TSY]